VINFEDSAASAFAARLATSDVNRGVVKGDSGLLDL
jgi:hypothetical protein